MPNSENGLSSPHSIEAIIKIVISDTTAITSLEQVGHLDLLYDLYHEIIIPNAVYKELQAYHGNVHKPWIVVKDVQDRTLIPKNRYDLLFL